MLGGDSDQTIKDRPRCYWCGREGRQRYRFLLRSKTYPDGSYYRWWRGTCGWCHRTYAMSVMNSSEFIAVVLCE
jgi:hypothetical protein